MMQHSFRVRCLTGKHSSKPSGMSYRRTFIMILSLLGFFSCSRPPRPVNGNITGWAPIYSDDPALRKVVSDTPHPIIQAGKIYVKDHFIYQVEVDSGIHITDISDPADPRQIAFIKSAGSTELAIRGHYLYTNNLNDIVVVDIADPAHVQEVSRVAHGFGMGSGMFPPGHGYFECVDPSKGTVTGWEQKELNDPKCYR